MGVQHHDETGKMVEMDDRQLAEQQARVVRDPLAVLGRSQQAGHAQLGERHAEPVRERRFGSVGGQVCHRCEDDLGGVRVPARKGERGEQHPLGRALDAQRHAHVGGIAGDPGQHPQHGLGVDRRRRGRLPGLGHRVPERLGPVPGAALGIGSRVRVHQGEVPDLPRTAWAGAGERAVGTQLDDRVVPGREVRWCAELGVVRYRESH